MRRARTIAVLTAIAAVSAIWLVGPSAASGPSATGGLHAAGGTTAAAPSATVETLLRYLPRGRLPIRAKCPNSKLHKCIAYRAVCTVDCNITARTTLVLPGPNLGPVEVSGAFDANQVFEAYIQLNDPALAALKANRNSARLRTRISAHDVTTGDSDIDRRTFRFKHG